jgi:hypothetical protein
VAEWLRPLNSNHLAPYRCGFESHKGPWIFSCEEAIQLAYETSVVLLRRPFVPGIIHRGAQKDFLNNKAGKSPYNFKINKRPATT